MDRVTATTIITTTTTTTIITATTMTTMTRTVTTTTITTTITTMTATTDWTLKAGNRKIIRKLVALGGNKLAENMTCFVSSVCY